MRTSKPISTISYNTEEFLKYKLDQLVKNHKVSDWIYVKHHAEADERKDHIHLWLKPNTLIDTMDLQKFLEEYDPENPSKPKKCIDFRGGKVDDWILYAQHYEPYLASKAESREYHYTRKDFVYADEDSFEDLYNHAMKGSDFAKRFQILEQLRSGSISPAELITNGTVPLNLAANLNAFKYMQNHYGLDRGSGEDHEDPE